MVKVYGEQIKGASDVEKFLFRALGNFDEPMLRVGEPSHDGLFYEIEFLVWAFGKPYAKIESEEKLVAPTPHKFNKTIICVTKRKEIEDAVKSLFWEVVERPEECSISIYDIPYIIADIEELAERSYLHTIGIDRVGLVGSPPEKFAPADTYVLLNPLTFYSLPDDIEGKIIFIQIPLVRVREFDFTKLWTERQEVCVALDKSVLPKKAFEGFERGCKHLNIPVVTKVTKENLREYKFVIFPVGVDIAPLHVSEGLKNAILATSIVITNSPAVDKLPTTEVTWDMHDDGDILAILVDKYLKNKGKWDDAEFRVRSWAKLLRIATIEGLLIDLASGKV